MEKNKKKGIILGILICIIVIGVIYCILDATNVVNFSSKHNSVDVNDGNNCLSDVVDYDTIQSVNKFWRNLRGKWYDGTSSLEIKEIDGYAAIIFRKHQSESSTGLIVSIENVSDNVEAPKYKFNVVRPLSSLVDESDELDKSFKLHFNEYNAPYYADSYIFEISELYRDILKIGDSEFKRVNN